MKNLTAILLLILLPFTALILSSFRSRPVINPLFLADTTPLPLYALAKDFKGKSISSSAGLLTLTSGFDNDFYQPTATARTGSFYVELSSGKITAVPSIIKPRLNISIVIDRSGSMAGEKMEVARKAAKGIIDQLSATDYVSVVIYDELIDLLQPATAVINKDSIKARIDKIRPRGSTNLWGGSELGYAQVKASYKKAYINRVLLISDGLANAGLINPARIKTGVQTYKDVEGISISTFGVGLDYNETLMTAMAETGAGNYYYIDQLDKLSAMFSKELSGLSNLAAQDAELKLLLPKGMTVTSAYPARYKQTGQLLTVNFGNLFADERKGLMFYFTIDDSMKLPLKLTTQLSYTSAGSGSPALISHDNLLAPAGTMDAYLTYFNQPVLEQVLLFAANENLEKATLETDKKNFDRAEELVDANKPLLAGYKNTSPELRRMDSVSQRYKLALRQARSMSADSVRQLQKSVRSDNYLIRNKKN